MFTLAEMPNINVELWTKAVFLDDIEVFATFENVLASKVLH